MNFRDEFATSLLIKASKATGESKNSITGREPVPSGEGGALLSEAHSKWGTSGTMRKWKGELGRRKKRGHRAQSPQNFCSRLQPLHGGARHSRRRASNQELQGEKGKR